VLRRRAHGSCLVLSCVYAAFASSYPLPGSLRDISVDGLKYLAPAQMLVQCPSTAHYYPLLMPTMSPHGPHPSTIQDTPSLTKTQTRAWPGVLGVARSRAVALAPCQQRGTAASSTASSIRPFSQPCVQDRPTNSTTSCVFCELQVPAALATILRDARGA
jgi:hypothetical protein